MFILFGFLGFLVPLTILIGIVYFIVRVSRNSEDKEALTVKEVAVDTGMFISLLTSIVALVSIIFSAIDKKFVDVLKQSYNDYGANLNEDVRVAVSVILVVFPIYLGLAYYKARYLKNNSDRRNIKAIKYVNYLTLIFAFIFILGSIVTTIYQYLGGELGVAFAYKLLTTIVIAVALGAYSYYSLRRNYENKSNVPNILAVLSLIAVIVSVVYSIKILGSPAEVRRAKFDEKRLVDMSGIQQEILAYWQKNKTLPAKIFDVQGDGFNSSFIVPTDPRTKDPYTYKVLENSKTVRATGQDCATFYPNKFNNYNINGSYDISKLSCEIPTKATFEICGNFETVRAYDANGLDQSPFGWDTSNKLGVKGLDITSSRYYDPIYYDSYTKNANWNHDKGNTCFKRTIDPIKYPQY
jgi:uncharacterized membrane protein YidH (DUF202 family)